MRVLQYWAGSTDYPYTVDYAWNFTELYTGNSMTWAYYAAYSGGSVDIRNGTKPIRKLSHFGQLSQTCPVMESGQAWVFDMAGGWGTDTITATIATAPHVKTLNQLFYDGHAGDITVNAYKAYVARLDSAKNYPFYRWGMPTH